LTPLSVSMSAQEARAQDALGFPRMHTQCCAGRQFENLRVCPNPPPTEKDVDILQEECVVSRLVDGLNPLFQGPEGQLLDNTNFVHLQGDRVVPLIEPNFGRGGCRNAGHGECEALSCSGKSLMMDRKLDQNKNEMENTKV
jgi:hypothetical protein